RHGLSRQSEEADEPRECFGRGLCADPRRRRARQRPGAIEESRKRRAARRLARPDRGGSRPVTRISLERIASIESRRHELAQAMARADVTPDEFVKLSKD